MRLRTRRRKHLKKSRKVRRVQRGGACPVGCIVDPAYVAPNEASNVNLTPDEVSCSAKVFLVGARSPTTIEFKEVKTSLKAINDFISSKSAFRNSEKQEIVKYFQENLANVNSTIDKAAKLYNNSMTVKKE